MTQTDQTTPDGFKQTEIGKIPNDWNLFDFENLAKLRKDIYKPKKSENLPYIGLEHINQEDLSINGYGSSSDTISNKYKYDQSNVLFGKLRPYFRKVYKPNLDGVCSTDIWVFEATEKCFLDYLFYLVASRKFVDLANAGSTGTRMPRANWGQIKKTKWPVPKINEQKEIAAILSSLDDKIELNRKMNQTLEEIGKALFRQWFVDFEFPNNQGNPYKSSGGEMVDSELGMIPKGWEVSAIGKETNTVLGGTPSRKKSDYWNGSIAWINSGAVNNFRIVVSTDAISSEGLKKSAAEICPRGTVVLAITGATLGQYSILEIDSSFNQSVVGIKESSNLKKEYIYYWINQTIHQLINARTGGAHQHINKGIVDSHKILLPPNKTMNKYYELTTPIFQHISIAVKQNLALTKIRDLLLPRLMCGKIRVN